MTDDEKRITETEFSDLINDMGDWLENSDQPVVHKALMLPVYGGQFMDSPSGALSDECTRFIGRELMSRMHADTDPKTGYDPDYVLGEHIGAAFCSLRRLPTENITVGPGVTLPFFHGALHCLYIWILPVRAQFRTPYKPRWSAVSENGKPVYTNATEGELSAYIEAFAAQSYLVRDAFEIEFVLHEKSEDPAEVRLFAWFDSMWRSSVTDRRIGDFAYFLMREFCDIYGTVSTGMRVRDFTRREAADESDLGATWTIRMYNALDTIQEYPEIYDDEEDDMVPTEKR